MVRSYGLTHIQLSVANLQRSLKFYQSAIGLVERFRLGEDCVMLGAPGARDVVTINADSSADRDAMGKTGGIAHFGFRLHTEGDLESALALASESGGTVLKRGTRSAGPHREAWAFVRDPDGYEVELFSDLA
jgi:catechol 2,3-dioxygenase-like lactoylglutathione lyase family enzyme